MRNRFKRLTALRTLDLLRSTETGSEEWKARRLREELAEHLRALILAKQKSRRRPRLSVVADIRKAN